MLYLAIFFSLFIYIVYRELEGSLDNCLVRNFVKRILPLIEYYRANLSSKRMKRNAEEISNLLPEKSYFPRVSFTDTKTHFEQRGKVKYG